MSYRPNGSFETRLSNVICDFIEEEYLQGKITIKERTGTYLRMRKQFALDDLASHHDLKAKILHRLSNGLYQVPVNLPGMVLLKRERRIQEQSEDAQLTEEEQCFLATHKLAKRS